MFERPDWTLFRTISGICQKAGVARRDLSRVICKEIVDNALDAAGTCRILLEGNTLHIEDNGPGIPGSDEFIARLFSISRPLTSSKLIRLPSRGALGNGARIIAAGAVSTNGYLTVETQGRILKLIPKDDGTTDFQYRGASSRSGTRISLTLGHGIQLGEEALAWADKAIYIAEAAKNRNYDGKSDPVWYDSEALFELFQASGTQPIQNTLCHFSITREGHQAILDKFAERLGNSINRAESDHLMGLMREHKKPVNPRKLGVIGDEATELGTHYARDIIELQFAPSRGSFAATIPYVIEVWAVNASSEDEVSVQLTVNQTPITTPLKAYKIKKALALAGCGLNHHFELGKRDNLYPVLHINIQTPYMTISSDGKIPDLLPLLNKIAALVRKVLRKVKTPQTEKRAEFGSMKTLIWDAIPEAVAKTSSNYRYRYSQRQVFYAVRPYIIETLGIEPSYNYFTAVLTEYENLFGELEGMYRDPRGSLYHPHLGDVIPLGTLNVEKYERPDWTFAAVIYAEKEGIIPLLQGAGLPNRRDVAILTSKGQASRAAKDLLDLMGDTDEPLKVFCLHDADAAGTMIYQSLVDETPSRPRRRVNIINLGLDPEEGLDMGLQVEKTNYRRKQPVARYLENTRWVEFLQESRIELNSMDSETLVNWLEAKLEAHGIEKVVPPPHVINDDLQKVLRDQLRQVAIAQVLRDAGIEEKVLIRLTELTPQLTNLNGDLRTRIIEYLNENPTNSWRDSLLDIAQRLISE